MHVESTTDHRRVARAAVVVSILVHAVALVGLRRMERPPRADEPPVFAIDVAPTALTAGALAPEQEDQPAPATAAEPSAEVPAPAPPADLVGLGLRDAGVDAELVAAVADARRPPRDAGVDADLLAVADAGSGDDDAGAQVASGDGDAGAQVASVDGDAGAQVASVDGDAGVSDGGEAGSLAVAGADGGTGIGDGGDGDAGVRTAGADPTGDPSARPNPGGAADLRTYFPAGHVVSVLVRLDRLRDTEWAPRVDAVFAPMPDYRALVGGSGIALVDVFDTLAISTPEPSDAAATTLVVRSRVPAATLRDRLDADDSPVAWAPVAGGALGRRGPSPRRFPGDRRVFLQWAPGWTALAQPFDLGRLLAPRAGALDASPPAAALPPWLRRVTAIEGEAGEPTGAAVVATAVGLFPASLPIPYGSGGTLPGPDRATVALEVVPRGFLVHGNVRFPDEAAAATAADLIVHLRAEILADRWTAIGLAQVGALHAIENLTIHRTGRRLAIETSISTNDARAFLTAVANLVDTYFSARRDPRP